MANSRGIETSDIGRMVLDLLIAHGETAFADEADAYTSQDGPGNVVIETFGVGKERDGDDTSNLLLATDIGERFAIRVTRVG